GAFMSMLGVSFLNEISNISDVSNAAEILEILRYKVKIALKQDGTYGSSKDGMDIALCMYNLETKGLCYAGAYNPLIIIRNNELFEYKATKSPIGIYPKEKEFENNEIQVFENDRIYMYSDGFMDQFGGENGKKYKSRNLKQLLLSISLETMDKQKIELENEFDSWMGSSYEQIDDMIIMGIKI
ncbi:MAG: SpoIIE family protein phosphatase, partial [Bacteroidales bacterium]|nr:SpoIIE family protein phosphatase [Bacteroidales bacterium]